MVTLCRCLIFTEFEECFYREWSDLPGLPPILNIEGLQRVEINAIFW